MPAPMLPLSLSACTCVSAIGAGRAATLDALVSRRSGLRPYADGGLSTWVGRVEGLDEVRLPPELERFDCRNNRLASVGLAADGFAAAARAAARRWGSDRVAVVLGTSTSGIASAEDAYRRRDPASGRLPADFDYRHTQDLLSLPGFVRAALGLRGPASVLSTACTSAAKAFGEAAELMAAGSCDAAVVGGVDSLCDMTLHGFAALELVGKGPCRPFDADRDGISIGEAAAFVLLERPEAGATGRVGLLGFGASGDAHHMSTPHPEGRGAIAAMRAALASAGLAAAAVDYVNFHGTGTRANDAAEDRAVLEVVGEGANLAVDANGRFDLETAVAYAEALLPYGLWWYEEAGDPHDFALQAELAKHYERPMATGENLFAHQEARNLLRYGGMRPDRDWLQFDCALSYGLVEYLRTLDVMKDLGWSTRRVVPHGGHQMSLNIAAGLHLGGNESYPDVFRPFGGFADGIGVEDGYVALPQIPGVGFEAKAELSKLMRELAEG